MRTTTRGSTELASRLLLPRLFHSTRVSRAGAGPIFGKAGCSLAAGFQHEQVDEHITSAMERLKALRPQEAIWCQALDNAKDVALSPMRQHIRPKLVMLGYASGGGDSGDAAAAIEFAAGVELLHTFMLVHDGTPPCGAALSLILCGQI